MSLRPTPSRVSSGHDTSVRGVSSDAFQALDSEQHYGTFASDTILYLSHSTLLLGASSSGTIRADVPRSPELPRTQGPVALPPSRQHSHHPLEYSAL